MPDQSFRCIFCDARAGTPCLPGCPSPASFDPGPAMDALGLPRFGTKIHEAYEAMETD